ncbi:hypothetical protein UlMin_039668 [Ulmus minor]
MASKFQVRSISFPSRSHPSTIRVEEELSKLKAWEFSLNTSSSSSSSSSICFGLSGLEELYDCVDDLLKMASTQQVLSHHQHEKFFENLLDGSVKLLDICGIAREVLVQTNEHVRALQSALRRRKGDSTVVTSIASYLSFRKKTKKNAKKLIISLKQVDNNFNPSQLVEIDDHLFAVIKVLREVCSINISIFQSLLLFLTIPSSKAKSSKWSLVSKLMHKGVVACEENQENVHELDNVDVVLSKFEGSEFEKMKLAQKRLETLEISINGLESGLGSVFRQLIKTRTSLLNIISQ